jgi:two-component sensor histidine kinase
MLAAFVRLKELELARGPAVPSAEAVQILLETIRIQTDAVARLHRSLASNGGHVYSDLAEHLHATCSPLASLLAGRVEVAEEFSPGCQVAPEQVLPLTQIVSEAITNAVKHAYPLGRGGKITVRSHRDELGGFVVEIADDGPGLAPGLDPGREGGLGLRLMRALSAQLGARLEFKSRNPGALVRLTIRPGGAQGAGTEG